MQAFLSIAIITLSLAIFYQDLSTRSVLWYLFPLLSLFGLMKGLQNGSVSPVLLSRLANFFIAGLQLLVLAAYFFFKEGKASLSGKLGPGDILFTIASACTFDTETFLLFITISLLVALLLHALFLQNRRYCKNGRTIPLAGWQALLLSVFFCIDLFFPLYSLAGNYKEALWT